MRHTPAALLTTLACLTLAACSSGARRAPAAPSAATPVTAASARGVIGRAGGVSWAGRDLPLEQTLAQARSSGKPALLCFVAQWCGYCRMLESQTLSDPSVGAHLAAYTVVRYDADQPVGRALAQRYGIHGFPSLVRVDAQGNKLASYEGYDAPSDFVRRIPRP